MQVQLFGWLIGGILLAVGLATYFLAPIVGPNPIFGVRIGYAYASRETWDKTNRFGGGLMAFVGIACVIVAQVLQMLNFPASMGMTAMTIFLLAGMSVATIGMFAYARNAAQSEKIARELMAVPFRWYYLAPVLVTFGLLLAFTALIYPTLPATHIPSHFNINDQADAWQTRDQFLLTILGISVFMLGLNVLVVVIATREPLIAFSRMGKSWRLDPASGLVLVSVVFAVVNLVFIALLGNIWWLVTHGALAFSFWIILAMTVLLIGLIIVLFFILGRRET